MISATLQTDRGHHLVVNAAWLMRLRWVAVVGQLITIGVVTLGLQVALQLAPLLAVVLFTVLTNVGLWIWLGYLDQATQLHHVPKHGEGLLATVLAIDLVSLTTLLYFTGGVANPFSIFYLVNLTLCAVVLSQRWGWALTAVALVGLGWLLAFHVRLPELDQPAHLWHRLLGWNATLADLGQVVATTTCAVVIMHFVKRVTRQLEQTQAELRRMEREHSRNEKLEALGTLAGGAAHELATPLSTIAVVAKEMAQHLGQLTEQHELREDVMLIRAEVEHCRSILQRMTGRAGQLMAEQMSRIPLPSLVDDLLKESHQAERVLVSLPESLRGAAVFAPREHLVQALRAVLQNALDASPPAGRVQLEMDCDGDLLRVVIRDEGRGMNAQELSRAGDPFFTTKEPGQGMGLGLFLARSVVERLGGQLRLESPAGQGVIATLEIPRRSPPARDVN